MEYQILLPIVMCSLQSLIEKFQITVMQGQGCPTIGMSSSSRGGEWQLKWNEAGQVSQQLKEFENNNNGKSLIILAQIFQTLAHFSVHKK